MKQSKLVLSLAVGASLAGLAAATLPAIAENAGGLFQLVEHSNGQNMIAADSAKCGSGSCGSKPTEHKCSSSSCSGKDKDGEHKCSSASCSGKDKDGEHKCSSASCSSTEKKETEHKCGSGSCGSKQ